MEPVLPLRLDLAGVGPGQLLRTLHRQLRAAVLDARLKPGTALPSTRALAATLGVGRNTVIGAYERLVAEGLADTRPGGRTTVRAASAARATQRAAGVPPAPGDRVPPGAVPARGGGDAGSAEPGPFQTGVPDGSLFPHAVWRRLVARAWRQAERVPPAYGPAAGDPALREAVAAHLAFARAVACTPAQVIVTTGAQQAFDLLARLLLHPARRTVAVEDPGYPPLWQALRAAGARLVGVPVDDEGLCVERVPPRARLVCVTPSHQSPTGAVLSAARRHALLAHARRHDALVVEDDYDGEFGFDPHPQDALQTLDGEGRVFYVGTFSKSLFPGLRIGYLVAPVWACPALATLKQTVDGHGPQALQQALAAFIAQGHLARHIRRVRRLYAQRRRQLVAAIEALPGRPLRVVPGAAGLHLTVEPRPGARGSASALRRLEAGLPGARRLQALALRSGREGLCIGYGQADAAAIAAAVRAWR